MRPEALRALRAKYVELRALRRAHDAGDPADPRARMRAVARRFPGALREIDELPIEAIEARIAALDRALAGAEPPAWAAPLSAYHGWMRVALRLKRELAPRRDPDEATAWLRRQALAPDEPALEALVEAVAIILRPPGGRLSRWVLARVAADAGRDPAEVEAEIFPPSPRRRALRARREGPDDA
ncbi:MAG TPA: hypothetical protein RMH99_22650 [Sandaracinaceae bacterium LLY-WYZ-13_1]|nr:hypothetical protein [Sandaracinaceae bacterium LLY-WYZ-13_1]